MSFWRWSVRLSTCKCLQIICEIWKLAQSPFTSPHQKMTNQSWHIKHVLNYNISLFHNKWLPHVADSFHTVHSAKLHRHGELTDDMYHIKEGPHSFCKHVNTPYELPVISLPAFESPHSGGAGKNLRYNCVTAPQRQEKTCSWGRIWIWLRPLGINKYRTTEGTVW